MTPSISLQTTLGTTLSVGDLRVTPEAQVLAVRLPFGGFVWTRPTAVRVEQGGETQRLRIVDLTRVLQLALWGLAFALWVGLRAPSNRKESQKWLKP